MEVRKQERQAETESVEGQDDIGMFGIPVKHFNSLGGYAYIIVLLVVVIGGFVWGFTQLNNSSLPKNKKNKKDKSPKKNA